MRAGARSSGGGDLGDRAARLRRRIVVLGIPACVAAASPVLFLWYALLQRYGKYTSQPLLHQGLVAWSVFTIVFVLLVALMLRASRVLVRRRALGWLGDIAAARHVDRERLVEAWRLLT